MIPQQALDLLPDLNRLARLMASADGPWWIIGSCALCLHGIEGIDPHDVDILMPADMAPRLEDLTGKALLRPPPDGKFRSDGFVRLDGASRDLEFMAGLQVESGGLWHEVEPRSRLSIRVQAGVVFLPELTELAQMLALFDRPKDRDRLLLIDRHLGSPPVRSPSPAA